MVSGRCREYKLAANWQGGYLRLSSLVLPISSCSAGSYNGERKGKDDRGEVGVASGNLTYGAANNAATSELAGAKYTWLLDRNFMFMSSAE